MRPRPDATEKAHLSDGGDQPAEEEGGGREVLTVCVGAVREPPHTERCRDTQLRCATRHDI